MNAFLIQEDLILIIKNYVQNNIKISKNIILGKNTSLISNFSNKIVKIQKAKYSSAWYKIAAAIIFIPYT